MPHILSLPFAHGVLVLGELFALDTTRRCVITIINDWAADDFVTAGGAAGVIARGRRCTSCIASNNPLGILSRRGERRICDFQKSERAKRASQVISNRHHPSVSKD